MPPSTHHDSLTGLANRRLLDDRLRQALNSAERRDGGLAVMLVGLALAGPDDGRLVTAQRLAPCLRRADALLRNADAALFRARHGPEPICFYR